MAKCTLHHNPEAEERLCLGANVVRREDGPRGLCPVAAWKGDYRMNAERIEVKFVPPKTA